MYHTHDSENDWCLKHVEAIVFWQIIPSTRAHVDDGQNMSEYYLGIPAPSKHPGVVGLSLGKAQTETTGWLWKFREQLPSTNSKPLGIKLGANQLHSEFRVQRMATAELAGEQPLVLALHATPQPLPVWARVRLRRTWLAEYVRKSPRSVLARRCGFFTTSNSQIWWKKHIQYSGLLSDWYSITWLMIDGQYDSCFWINVFFYSICSHGMGIAIGILQLQSLTMVATGQGNILKGLTLGNQ